MKKKNFIIMSIVIPFILITLPALCDEKKDEIKEIIQKSLKEYEQGNYTESAQDLEYASQLIRQKKGELLKKFLPKPLKGWKVESSSSKSAPTSLFGGMTSASKKYSRGNSFVIIKIVTDSPIIQSFLSILSNPALATAGGAKLKTIKGQKAIINIEDNTNKITVNIVVANKILVEINGTNCSLEDVLAYAEKIDYKKLSKF